MEQFSPQELLEFWKKGKSLYSALFIWTDSLIRKEYESLFSKRQNENKRIFKDGDVLPSLALTLLDANNAMQLNSQIEQAVEKLKYDLLNKAISEKLFLFGYEAPVKSSDTPQIIPLHVIPQKISEINWQESSFQKNGIQFLNIRVINKLPQNKLIKKKSVTPPKLNIPRIGRPSRQKEIIKAYEDLKADGYINYLAPLKSHTELIQKTVQKLFPEITDTKGMAYEAIRRYIGVAFQKDKNSKPTSKL